MSVLFALAVVVPLAILGTGVVFGAIGTEVIRGSRIVLDDPKGPDAYRGPHPDDFAPLRASERVKS